MKLEKNKTRLSSASSCPTNGFTLIEVLVVLSIVSLLAAMLVPVFWSVRGKARQTVCSSNLRQIGLAINLYSQDYDGLFPYAVDPVDRSSPSLWSHFPAFAADVPNISLIQDVLQPYTETPELFHCPADEGFEAPDFAQVPLPSFPSAYEANGISYGYRTELAATRAQLAGLTFPERVNVMFDSVGYWHGTLVPIASRYNVLYADGHIKNVSNEQIYEAWGTSLR